MVPYSLEGMDRKVERTLVTEDGRMDPPLFWSRGTPYWHRLREEEEERMTGTWEKSTSKQLGEERQRYGLVT